MSCCRPEYRKVVNEKEEKVNQQGKDSLPLLAKIIIVIISAAALGTAFLL
jgi:hypothetical protein